MRSNKGWEEAELDVISNTDLFSRILEATLLLTVKERRALATMRRNFGWDDEGIISHSGIAIEPAVLKSLVKKGCIRQSANPTSFFFNLNKLLGIPAEPESNIIPMPKVQRA